jgi:predicted dehydrogenase
MKHVRIGVIGCGYWGPNLIRNFVSLFNSDVVIVADLKPDRLEHIQRLYPQIQTTNDYQQFFSLNLDAAVIATPPATHFAIARDCLEQGLHTYVEKPLTLNSRDCQTLINMANMQGLKLMVGHTFEYNLAVRKVKEIIEAGDLGEIYYLNAVRVNLGLFQPDMNVLWDLAPHDISILLYLLDQSPISVQAIGEDCIIPGKHDIAYMHLEFPNKVNAHIHTSWLDPRKVRRITVVGSEKMLVYDDIESLEKIKIFDKGVDVPPHTDTYGDFQCSYRYGDITIPAIKFTEPLRIECQHFIDNILKRDMHPISCGEQGLEVVRILEAAQRSLENHGERQMLVEEEQLSVQLIPEYEVIEV